VLRLLVDAFDQWNLGRAWVYSAALAFYTVFSIVPLVALLVRIGVPFDTADLLEQKIVDVVQQQAGTVPASYLEEIIESSDLAASSSVATLLGIIFLVYGASTIFHSLQNSINAMYELPDAQGGLRRGVLYFLLTRLLSAAIVVGIGMLFLALLVANVIAIAIPATPIEIFFENFRFTAFIVNYLVWPIAITLLFALTYKYLPGGIVRWRDVMPGSALTMLLFLVGNRVIRWYLEFVFQASIYGASGTLILFLLWIYYITLIVLFGAKVIALYAERFGEPIHPKRRLLVNATIVPAEPKPLVKTGP
jgi:membrane protein